MKKNADDDADKSRKLKFTAKIVRCVKICPLKLYENYRSLSKEIVLLKQMRVY